MTTESRIVLLSAVVSAALGITVASNCKSPLLMDCCTATRGFAICQDGTPCGDVRTSGEKIKITAPGSSAPSGGYKFDSVELEGTCEYDNYDCDGMNGCVYQGTIEIGCFNAEGPSCPR